jgi:L,D-peptidoglycan transpeptidase YkuD (ErfK/YbiS/YcfS/YnhG family)
MIIINKSGYLKYKDFKFKCAFGKAGVGDKKIEGDNITPKGTFGIVKIFYRSDRIKKISSKFKLIKITKNMGWCDDSKSENYNKLIKLPSKFSYEKLYRKDNLYDLILVLNYNINPTIKNRGSAIFIHIKKGDFTKTKGCITLKKENLLKIISLIQKNTKVIIG